MSLAKNLGERVGVQKNFMGRGGWGKKKWKILLPICENLERSPKSK
jgi:hypothetical protein